MKKINNKSFLTFIFVFEIVDKLSSHNRTTLTTKRDTQE